jgi:hypothetical protein
VRLASKQTKKQRKQVKNIANGRNKIKKERKQETWTPGKKKIHKSETGLHTKVRQAYRQK